MSDSHAKKPGLLWRYERKMRVEHRDMDAVNAEIRTHPAHFRILFPPRQVHNVYLDTLSLQDYRDTLEGLAQRQKLRLRWYSPLGSTPGGTSGSATTPVHLERKRREGSVMTKLVHPLPHWTPPVRGDPQALLPPRPPDSQSPTQALFGAWALRRPMLVNHYHRHYWLSACGRFRLTVDHNIHSWPWQHSTASHRHPGIVLELKYALAHDHGARHVLTRLGFPMVRNSKYAQGIEGLKRQHAPLRAVPTTV